MRLIDHGEALAIGARICIRRIVDVRGRIRSLVLKHLLRLVSLNVLASELLFTE